jgi:inorganic triphosphatase YgiF
MQTDGTPGQALSSPPSAAPAALEVELKLAASPEDAAKFGRLPLVKGATTGRAVTRHMHSVYYDTPDLTLKAQGMALRLRREGTRWVQTLKGAGRVEGGLHQREEHEVQVPAPLLDYGALAAWGMNGVLADPEQRMRLQPVFTCDFKRTIRHLALSDGTRFELCTDRGTIAAGEGIDPISEIELELKAGSADRLIDFGLVLLEEVPLRLEPRSKAERGYALAEKRAEAPTKAGAPAQRAGMSVTDAFRAVVFACVAHLQANQAGAMAGADIEYLHQARVALRRLRSAFSVFNRAFPRAALEDLLGELRWLGEQLGPARDWDVFTCTTLPRLAGTFGDDAAMRALREHADRLRAVARRDAVEALAAKRHTALLLRLNGVFYRTPWTAIDDQPAAALRAEPLGQFAAEELSRRHRKTLKRGRKHAELDASGLHRLRIQVKKLRYAAEFFSSLYERKAVRGYTAALAALQELLGTLNDAATVERLCEVLREDHDEAAFREALGAVRGWAAATAHDHLEQLPQAWKRFRDTKPFW